MSFFFLMSSERSGSNFITKLLNGHSNICGPSTKHIINPVARNLFRYEPVSNINNWNELLKDIHKLLNVNFSVWKKKFTLEDLQNIAPVGDITSLIKNIFYEEAKANGKQFLFIKENHTYEFLPFLLLNFPDTKYIYMVRDPRDMALSWKKNDDHPGGVVKAAKQWKKDQQNNLKNYNELRKRGKSFLVKYEDLISDAVGYTKKIINFLGMQYEDSILNFYQDEITIQNAKMQKAWGNLSKSIIPGNKNKYKKELSDYEIRLIEKICFFEMKFFDYECQNTLSFLNKISEKEIDDYEQEENKSIYFNRSEGVKGNMEAKKTFYQKLINEDFDS